MDKTGPSLCNNRNGCSQKENNVPRQMGWYTYLLFRNLVVLDLTWFGTFVTQYDGKATSWQSYIFAIMAKLHHGKATSWQSCICQYLNSWTSITHTNHRDNLYDETLVWSLWSHTDTKKTGADNYVTELSNKDVVDVVEIDPRQANTCSNGSNSTITTTQQLRRLGSILQSSFFVIISIVTWKNRRIKVAQKWFH